MISLIAELRSDLYRTNDIANAVRRGIYGEELSEHYGAYAAELVEIADRIDTKCRTSETEGWMTVLGVFNALCIDELAYWLRFCQSEMDDKEENWLSISSVVVTNTSEQAQILYAKTSTAIAFLNLIPGVLAPS